MFFGIDSTFFSRGADGNARLCMAFLIATTTSVFTDRFRPFQPIPYL
jgi:hypothetical protein